MLEVTDIIELNDFEGNFENYQSYMYGIFHKQFYDEKVFYRGKRVVSIKKPQYKHMDYSFIHMTSTGKDHSEVSLKRLERVHWCGDIISGVKANHENIKIWCEKRSKGGKRKVLRHLIWFNDEYLIVLEESKRVFLIITAFVTLTNSQKRRQQEKYEQYLDAESTAE